MCEPTTIAVISALGSAAATGMSMKAQQSAVSSQNAANNAWRAYQQDQRQKEGLRQDELRGKAEQARQQGLEELNPQKQQEVRAGEENRLATEIMANTNVNQDVGGQLLAGERSGGEAIQNDFASRMNQASSDARKRLTALAGVQSYGGSFGGMKNYGTEALARSDQGINLANNMRQGSLGAYGLAKGVAPPSQQPVKDPYGGIASSLAGIAGTAFGTAMQPGAGATAKPLAATTPYTAFSPPANFGLGFAGPSVRA